MKVALRPVTRENVRALCDLRLRPDQHELVAPAAVTIAEAHYEPAALLRAIYADDDPVGILFVETEGLVPYLVRFMITEERQRGGIGRPAVELLAQELREAGSTELEVSFVPVDLTVKTSGGHSSRNITTMNSPVKQASAMAQACILTS
jgi:diamine N-acetyltransferase